MKVRWTAYPDLLSNALVVLVMLQCVCGSGCLVRSELVKPPVCYCLAGNCVMVYVMKGFGVE